MTTSNEVELFRIRLSRGFYEWNVNEVMKTVTKNPKVLSNCGKTLALQRACDMDRNIVSVELISLLIEEGSRQNFGPRGGLRSRASRSVNAHQSGSSMAALSVPDHTSLTPLQVLVKRGSLQVLKFLSEAKPPLLCKEDVSASNLLHFAAGHGHVDVLKYLMSLDPEAAYKRDQSGALPIHLTCTSRKEFHVMHEVREILLGDYIDRDHLDNQHQYNANLANSKNTSNSTTVDNAAEELNHDEDAINILEWFFPHVQPHSSKGVIAKYVEDVAQIMNNHNVSIPLLCAAIRVGASHPHLKCIIDLVHNSATVREQSIKSNRLPIHLAVERGVKWHQGLKDIIDAYPAAIYEADPKTGLYPAALAAASSVVGDMTHCNLDSIYELMQHSPSM